MSKLNTEEKEILDAFEQNKLRRPTNVNKSLDDHKAIAEATFKKDARINIRLSSKDLYALKVRALKDGIPYQTLASSILHKFADGQFAEK